MVSVVIYSDKILLFTTKFLTGRLPMQLYIALMKASSLESFILYLLIQF